MLNESERNYLGLRILSKREGQIGSMAASLLESQDAEKRDAREDKTLAIAKEANRLASEANAIARLEAAAASRSARYAMYAALIATMSAIIATKDQILALILGHL